jgi:hypothetical protein
VGLKSTSSLPFSGWKSHHTTQDLSIVLSFWPDCSAFALASDHPQIATVTRWWQRLNEVSDGSWVKNENVEPWCWTHHHVPNDQLLNFGHPSSNKQIRCSYPTFAAQNQVLHLVSPILRQTVNPTLCKEVGKNVPTPPKVAWNRKTKISANWPKTKTMMVSRGDHHWNHPGPKDWRKPRFVGPTRTSIARTASLAMRWAVPGLVPGNTKRSLTKWWDFGGDQTSAVNRNNNDI